MLFTILVTNSVRNEFYLRRIKRKKRGEKRDMPVELIKEFIGKVCSITLFNGTFAIRARIESVEGNWIRIKIKDTIRIVNGDTIRDIELLPEKYQK